MNQTAKANPLSGFVANTESSFKLGLITAMQFMPTYPNRSRFSLTIIGLLEF